MPGSPIAPPPDNTTPWPKVLRIVRQGEGRSSLLFPRPRAERGKPLTVEAFAQLLNVPPERLARAEAGEPQPELQDVYETTFRAMVPFYREAGECDQRALADAALRRRRPPRKREGGA